MLCLSPAVLAATETNTVLLPLAFTDHRNHIQSIKGALLFVPTFPNEPLVATLLCFSKNNLLKREFLNEIKNKL